LGVVGKADGGSEQFLEFIRVVMVQNCTRQKQANKVDKSTRKQKLRLAVKILFHLLKNCETYCTTKKNT